MKYKKYFFCLVNESEQIEYLLLPGRSKFFTHFLRPVKYRGVAHSSILMDESNINSFCMNVRSFKALISKVNSSLGKNYSIINFRIMDIDGEDVTKKILTNERLRKFVYNEYLNSILEHFNPTLDRNADIGIITSITKANPNSHIIFYQSTFSLEFSSYGTSSKAAEIKDYYNTYVLNDTIIPAKNLKSMFNAVIHSMRVKGIHLPKKRSLIANSALVFEIDTDEAYAELKLKWDMGFGYFINVSEFKKYI